ncbi:MAG: hypothetical protein ACFE0O_12695 [Opitutales bacterium]
MGLRTTWFRLLLLVVLLPLLAACRSSAPWQEFVQDADFTHYRTFRLMVSGPEPAEQGGLPPGLAAIDASDVANALRERLRAKGFRPVGEGDEPDFYVAAWWESHPIHHWDPDLFEEKLMERKPGLERRAWRFRVEVMDGRSGEVFWIHQSDPLAETRWTGFELERAYAGSLDRFPEANIPGRAD